MKVPYTWLQSYFETPLPSIEKLADAFTFHSFEIEGIEGDVIDVKILPDRAHYCLSQKGIALEASVLLGIPRKAESELRYGVNFALSVPVTGTRMPKVTVIANDFCRRFTARYVENIATTGTPNWAVKFLTEVGSRSISPIVDATNVVMFDMGQPLHAFDADKIEGDIVVRKAVAGEKITLLDGKEYTLTGEDHVIADATGPLDIAGVKGGKRAEVSATTKNVLLTSANFDPTFVRRTSTRLNLRNEASKRFENEITPELALRGMVALSACLQTIIPQAVFSPIVDIYPKPVSKRVIDFRPDYVGERLGVVIPEATVKDILNRFGIDVVVNSKDKWQLTIPHDRLDVVIPEDVAEEVGRVYGYEHVIGQVPPAFAKAPALNPVFTVVENIRNVLVGAGFSEVYLYTLAAKGDIEVAYPLASDKSALRTTLAPGVSKCLEMNAHNAELLGVEAVTVFEIGKTFKKAGAGGSAGSLGTFTESLVLAIGATQVKKVKGIDGKSRINEAVEKLKSAFGIDFPIKTLLSTGPLAVCEIELDHIVEALVASGSIAKIAVLAPKAMSVNYRQFSLYPFIVRDIAVFVDGAISQDEVWTEIEKGIFEAGADKMLARHSLFDTFKKDTKTSYAFRLVFQSMERTLTDIEINSVMDKINSKIAGRGWQVR